MTCQSTMSTYHAPELYRAHIYGPTRDLGVMTLCRTCLEGYFLEGCRIDMEPVRGNSPDLLTLK